MALYDRCNQEFSRIVEGCIRSEVHANGKLARFKRVESLRGLDRDIDLLFGTVRPQDLADLAPWRRAKNANPAMRIILIPHPSTKKKMLLKAHNTIANSRHPGTPIITIIRYEKALDAIPSAIESIITTAITTHYYTSESTGKRYAVVSREGALMEIREVERP